MARWGFWDWVAYLCLGIAALGLAVGAALKGEPDDVAARLLPSLFADQRWAYAPIVLFALGSLILVIRFAGPSILELSARTPTERIFVDVTPRDIMAIIETHTIIQQEGMLKVYLGKWIKVTGKVSNIRLQKRRSRTSGVTVHLFIGDHRDQVVLHFQPSWVERLNHLQKNQNISAIGRIEDVGILAIELTDCEIVDAPSTH